LSQFKTIAFRYKLDFTLPPNDEDSFIDGDCLIGNTITQLQFNGVDVKRPIPIANIDPGAMLNGYQYENKLYSTNEYDVIISADEINDDIQAFMDRFWNAPYKYVCYKNGNYIEVVAGGGKIPVSYIDNNENFPEYSFTFTKVNPL